MEKVYASTKVLACLKAISDGADHGEVADGSMQTVLPYFQSSLENTSLGATSGVGLEY